MQPWEQLRQWRRWRLRTEGAAGPWEHDSSGAGPREKVLGDIAQDPALLLRQVEDGRSQDSEDSECIQTAGQLPSVQNGATAPGASRTLGTGRLQ